MTFAQDSHACKEDKLMGWVMWWTSLSRNHFQESISSLITGMSKLFPSLLPISASTCIIKALSQLPNFPRMEMESFLGYPGCLEIKLVQLHRRLHRLLKSVMDNLTRLGHQHGHHPIEKEYEDHNHWYGVSPPVHWAPHCAQKYLLRILAPITNLSFCPLKTSTSSNRECM